MGEVYHALPLLAERVALDWLDRYGPTIGDQDATQRQAQDAHEGDETLVRR